MHPDLYFAIHQERERELVQRLERTRVLRERSTPAAGVDAHCGQLWTVVHRATNALAGRVRDLRRMNSNRSAVACCATA